MNTTHSSFLKEMGITEWSSRETSSQSIDLAQTVTPEVQAAQKSPEVAHQAERGPRAQWWFFGTQPQGDAQLLFQNIIRVLGLSRDEWSWKSPADNLAKLSMPESGLPVVVFAFGGPAVQKITGERDPLPQLRETILALNTDSDDEIPVVASFDLSQITSQSKDKAMLWQDLLLAKSVLQNS